ncbi:MAG: class I SAM-dependent methyltransferase, partial [Clostridiaceae bacterium]|nr:class I SAM-dependent methyltransferase [Clostridiaceae bacterium]
MVTQKIFFNSMAQRWDIFCRHDKEKIDFILNLLNIKYGSRILDVGTGTGILIPFLINKVGDQGEITAVDFSEK